MRMSGAGEHWDCLIEIIPVTAYLCIFENKIARELEEYSSSDPWGRFSSLVDEARGFEFGGGVAMLPERIVESEVISIICLAIHCLRVCDELIVVFRSGGGGGKGWVKELEPNLTLKRLKRETSSTGCIWSQDSSHRYQSYLKNNG